jgi:uncharacterized protein
LGLIRRRGSIAQEPSPPAHVRILTGEKALKPEAGCKLRCKHERFKQGRLLRIFIDEDDRLGLKRMYTAVLEFLQSKDVGGATVLRGIEGYGRHHEIHMTKTFWWIANLLILIEVVDDGEKLEAILPELEELVEEGLVTLEAVEYLRLRRESGGQAASPVA